METQSRQLIKTLLSLSSKLKLLGREIAKRSGSLLQGRKIISDRKTKPRGSGSFFEFKQLLRRLGLVTAATVSEAIRLANRASKYDLEANTRDIKQGTEQVPLEITVKRSNLNEMLAQQLRQKIGIDCQALEIGSLQIEHERYYGDNFPMSPKITTNRGCIIVKGKRFNLIQVIQRN